MSRDAITRLQIVDFCQPASQLERKTALAGAERVRVGSPLSSRVGTLAGSLGYSSHPVCRELKDFFSSSCPFLFSAAHALSNTKV